MSDKPVRLHVGARDGSSFWTEPLGFVDAKVLAQMLCKCGMAVAWHQNNRARHRQIETLFAASPPENIAFAKWVVGCGCESCGNNPSECRIVRIAPPVQIAEVKIDFDPKPAPPPSGSCYGSFTQFVMNSITKALLLPASLLKPKEGGHAS